METSKKRVLIGGLFHETHTFVEGKTVLADFVQLSGEDLWTALGDASVLDGALSVAQEKGWDVAPSILMRATPSAMADDEVVEVWWEQFQQDLQREKDNIDGIYLVLHGAMVSQSYPDVEGEILRRIREISGVLLCGATDLHANFTPLMAQNSNLLVTYRENPHTDARETAVRAANLMDDLMHSGVMPVTLWDHPSIMWPPPGTGTADEPMKTLECMARELEAGNEDILAVNVHAGFSFADIPETGVSFSINVARDTPECRAALQSLSDYAVHSREQGNVVSPALESVMPEVKSLIASGKHPVLLVEPSDNVGGGAPGDDTAVLRAFLHDEIQNSAVVINDPAAVAVLFDLPAGAIQRVSVGGKGSRLGSGPIELDLEVISKSDGKFVLEDLHSHMASMTGENVDMGNSVLTSTNGVWILLTSLKTAPMDLGQLRSQGLIPETLSAIGVKAAVAHRQAYDPIAAASFTVETTGPCTSRLSSLPFEKIRRPIYPLDEI